MKIRSLRLVTSLALIVPAQASAPAIDERAADLAIIGASVLDVASGAVLTRQTVTMRDGIITTIANDVATSPRANHTIKAHGRLLTPAFIDVHLHTCSIYLPDCTNPQMRAKPLSMNADSIASYRRHMASLYLPYGVTAVRDVGTSEQYMPMMLAWMKRSGEAPDYYPVGADLISPDVNHIPAPWQVQVADSAAAARKVREYFALGIRNIKLYWRLQESAFKGGLYAAQALGMNVTAHVDFSVVPVDCGLALGLPSVQHMTSWTYYALNQSQFDGLYKDVAKRLGTINGQVPGYFYLAVPEEWNTLGPNNPKLLALIQSFKSLHARVTPTLHVFAEPLGITWFSLPPRDLNEDASHFSSTDRARAIAGFRIMASYVKRLHDAGVGLSIGTDTPEPGKSVLSEMLLLNEAGIPMSDVFRIATIESAREIGHASEYGEIKIGKRANLVMFEGNPLITPRDVTGAKTVIKDGVVVVTASGKSLTQRQPS